ncbi:MAG TPA: DUF4870 domain-containing protein [Gillisia sp.]|nr:DUF4870 domain-containing protein [Gillisia sp.]
MNNQTTNPDKTMAALIHLSTFSKFFIPFGNFIFPLILWTAKKQDPFVDEHGKQAINFQISIFLYFIMLACTGIAGIVFFGIQLGMHGPFSISEEFINMGNIANVVPLLLFIGFMGLLLLALLILDIISVITATMKASEGHFYKYPLSINFITPTRVGNNQSKNEQFNNTQNQRQ